MPTTKPVRTNGWVIRVQPIARSLPAKYYATVADDRCHAEAIVGDYCNITYRRVVFEKVLTRSDVARLALKRGVVKPYVL